MFALLPAMLSFFFDKDDGGTTIPARAEVKLEDTWDLTPLYRTPEAWADDFARLQREYPAVSAFRGKVGESAESLRDTILTLGGSLDLNRPGPHPFPPGRV